MSNEKITWSGKTTSYHHKLYDTPNPPDTPKGLRKVWYLDVQWSTCPEKVEDQVKDLWHLYELGNDHYCINTTLESLEEMDTEQIAVEQWNSKDVCWKQGILRTNAITQWIREQEPSIGPTERIVIHWWW